ncbi:hypothetical protein EDEG_00775 [Edhazardia aedis USNM 41457]|uniref:UBC core domain-containing protein n=1 Tax=Edhazardia aedis (strain USNM 41457) TaxID=1003232 RepID=J8ZZR6_EDHAE|nr:hypothetical protein EDEG_00775 [Edhazardia aedis USNM 41457]|eukprot:EJW05128.1 hypothetical protein EDEG_00775 [Edhazardia aedis USNM 41457]
MSTPAKKRLLKDLAEVEKSDTKIFVHPIFNNIMHWVSLINGPDKTDYSNGIFTLLLTFDESYPFTPPNITFISEMFHPNIYPDGKICLDVLGIRWSPAFSVLSILLSIQSLLSEPNLNSPANQDAAQMISENPDKYREKIKEMILSGLKDIKKHYFSEKKML